MNNSWKAGFGFGVTSAIITTLGLMIGLKVCTQSKLAVIGGIISIAICDALSDSLGMHISQEYSNQKVKRIWQATISTFISKLLLGFTFIIAILIFEINTAIIVNIVWGLLILIIFSYIIAKNEKEKPYKVIFEHLLIAIIVIIATYFIGLLISKIFV